MKKMMESKLEIVYFNAADVLTASGKDIVTDTTMGTMWFTKQSVINFNRDSTGYHLAEAGHNGQTFPDAVYVQYGNKKSQTASGIWEPDLLKLYSADDYELFPKEYTVYTDDAKALKEIEEWIASLGIG